MIIEIRIRINMNSNNNKCPFLSQKDLKEILYLSNQSSGGRTRLISNLYKLDKASVYSIVELYNIHR